MTERQGQSFITGIKDRSTVGYKYFQFEGRKHLALELRGNFEGCLAVSHDEKGDVPIGELKLQMAADHWKMMTAAVTPKAGRQALYLHFTGTGTLDLKTLVF